MNTMLDVAGGVVIGGLDLAALWLGVTLLLAAEELYEFGLGGLLVAAGGVTAFWLVFMHSGAIRIV